MKTKKISKLVGFTAINSDYEFILLAAMRYAIGRRSYAVGLVASYIKSMWDHISDNCKKLLQRDLEYEISQADRGLEFKIFTYDPLGDKCDRETWITLNTWMIKKLDNRKDLK